MVWVPVKMIRYASNHVKMDWTRIGSDKRCAATWFPPTVLQSYSKTRSKITEWESGSDWVDAPSICEWIRRMYISVLSRRQIQNRSHRISFASCSSTNFPGRLCASDASTGTAIQSNSIDCLHTSKIDICATQCCPQCSPLQKFYSWLCVCRILSFHREHCFQRSLEIYATPLFFLLQVQIKHKNAFLLRLLSRPAHSTFPLMNFLVIPFHVFNDLTWQMDFSDSNMNIVARMRHIS